MNTAWRIPPSLFFNEFHGGKFIAASQWNAGHNF
jgi:hypothetical protein